MISNIGKKFLEHYNKKEGKNYTPWEFFENIFFPLFFDHSADKYLMYPINTPFTSGVLQTKGKYNSHEFRLECLIKLKEKFYSDSFDMSCVIGGGSESLSQSTSGQFNPIYYQKTADYKIYSWIGNALGVTVGGGYTILFDNVDILYSIYEGWFKYREILDSEMFVNMKGRQINTWNGVYLYNSLGFEEENITNFIKKEKFDTIKWNFIFSNLHEIVDKNMFVYIYNLGQYNKTIGNIFVDVENIYKPIQWYKKIFGENDFIDNKKKINEMFGSFYKSVTFASQKGSIGIENMKPCDIDICSVKKEIELKTYKTWIMSIIDNDEVFNDSENLADELINFVSLSKKGKTVYKNMVEEDLLKKYKINLFLRELNKIIDTGDFKKDQALLDMTKRLNNMDYMKFEKFVELTKLNYKIKN